MIISVPTLKPCVFLDRDGTIIRECHFLKDPAKIKLEDRAIEALKHLQNLEFVLVVVSNQSGVGRGLFTIEDVEKVNGRLREILLANGVEIMAWLFCPHSPDDACDCRKPKTGLIKKAVGRYNLNLDKSIVIGDKRSDMELAKACNIPGYLVRTGYGCKYSEWAKTAGFSVFENLYEAAISITTSSHT